MVRRLSLKRKNEARIENEATFLRAMKETHAHIKPPMKLAQGLETENMWNVGVACIVLFSFCPFKMSKSNLSEWTF